MATCVHRSPAEYIPAVNTKRFLVHARRILVVGVAGGRDYYTLRAAGKDVVALDISPQSDIPDLVLQSIEQRTPFEDNSFDGVVMNEVLEHLFGDQAALREVHRILKPNGTLVATVPYYSGTQDIPEYHVRIHSSRTISRLLQASGFETEEHFVRGVITRLPNSSLVLWYLLRSLQVLAGTCLLDSRRGVTFVNAPLERVERFLGSHRWTAWVQRYSKAYGGIIKARKTTPLQDVNSVQIRHFANITLD